MFSDTTWATFWNYTCTLLRLIWFICIRCDCRSRNELFSVFISYVWPRVLHFLLVIEKSLVRWCQGATTCIRNSRLLRQSSGFQNMKPKFRAQVCFQYLSWTTLHLEKNKRKAAKKQLSMPSSNNAKLLVGDSCILHWKVMFCSRWQVKNLWEASSKSNMPRFNSLCCWEGNSLETRLIGTTGLGRAFIY